MIEMKMNFSNPMQGLTAAEVQRAASSAINKTLSKIGTASTREIARRARISPLKGLTRRTRFKRATAAKLVAQYDVATADLSALWLQPKQSYEPGGGVHTYGPRFFGGAFLMPTGGSREGKSRAGGGGSVKRWVVARRTGRSRLPVEVVKVRVRDVINAVLAEKRNAALAEIWSQLRSQIAWRTQKKAA
jgi:hypothetical protein